jgi:hypothetical protein
VFDDDVWDLSGLADAPVVMSAHRRILDFTMITNPRWRWVAREYLMARLAPRHPAVATLPQAFRAPISQHSLWADLHLLADWFNHLTDLGISCLEDVAQRHCQAYLAVASRSSTDPDRRLSPSTVTARIRATQVLALYSEILTDSYRPGFTPWAGRSADVVAGHIRTAGNSVPPVPDSLLRPLLANCLYLLETIGPHLVAEASAARAADQREAASRRTCRRARSACCDKSSKTTAPPGSRRPDWRLRPWPGGYRSAGTRPTRCCTWRGIPSSWPRPGRSVNAVTWRRCGPSWKKWVQQCGTAQPWCRDAPLIARHDTDQLVPWAVPMSRQQLASRSTRSGAQRST